MEEPFYITNWYEKKSKNFEGYENIEILKII
jgi:hypothetical protein